MDRQTLVNLEQKYIDIEYWEIPLASCCMVTFACGTRDSIGNRLVIFTITHSMS